MANDPYSELGLKKGASDTEIQKAFRKLAKQLHPDTNRDNKVAEERFKRVTAAYDFLKDADKRKKFDRGEIDADGREIFRGFAGGGRGPLLEGEEVVEPLEEEGAGDLVGDHCRCRRRRR